MQFDFREVKKIHADMLDTFIEVCEKYDLRWVLAYGTLLGAVRDKKFIDWDHDVDIWMPYADYKKLNELNSQHKVFPDNMYLIGYAGVNKDCRNFKVARKGTTMLLYDKPVCRMFMDIYPIMNIEDSAEELEKLITLSCKFREQYDSICQSGETSKLKDLVSEFENTVDKLKKENDVFSTSIEDSVGYNYFGPEPVRDRIIRKKLPEIDFDNFEVSEIMYVKHKVRIPKNYDTILTILYGDYLTPPDIISTEKWSFDLTSDFNS